MESEIPTKWKRYYKLLIELRMHVKEELAYTLRKHSNNPLRKILVIYLVMEATKQMRELTPSIEILPWESFLQNTMH